ncbi:DUF975 family protein [Weissella diestrammenae]|uniref:DUF975 family protein n=1 Tax=Weissella diestrammenae TaxID=1162633 RepID=A0A7G9T736_9LACO|nr:DUF975 family protein [Weissella diestrammenae]MCM0582490.1 DUF975 family protein [Weissella diestrammenae]QNN75911.1 DUF975 family protein [Weissella diestrammenae]
MLENYNLRQRGWQRVKTDWLKVVFLTWPLIVWQLFLTTRSVQQTVIESTQGRSSEGLSITSPSFYLYSLGQGLWSSLIEAVLIGVISFGVVWTLILWQRSDEAPRSPLTASFYFFGRQTVVDSVVLMGIRFLYTILWSLLLIVPGIIKSIAYSQAEYIYAEDVKRGLPIESMNEYITRSRDMMDGHKLQYFWLQFSFILWWVLVALTAGLAAFWVIPYYQATMAEFYIELRREREFGSRAEIRAARPYPTTSEDDEI